jgi:Methyltransferase domain
MTSAGTAWVSSKTGQFRYFNRQLDNPDWSRLAVLDFGGNVGNLLDGAGANITPDRYWCLDVCADAIAIGRRKHPAAHWIFYDRYSHGYNQAGMPGLALPTLDRRFDCILAYSVFTHVLPGEMQELIAGLMSCLAIGGRLAFTFIDPRHESWPSRPGCSNLQWRLERARHAGRDRAIDGDIDRALGAAWSVLVDDVDLRIEQESIAKSSDPAATSLHVFHSRAFMRRLYPHSRILPPVHGEMQHCCVLGA